MCETEKSYEEECRKIREENKKYLDMLDEYLKASGLAKKTIYRHMSNADFYINGYLLQDEPKHITEGIACINTFFEYFFVKKCLWATPDTVRSTATSIKKLYKCLAEHGIIDNDSYEFLCSDIKSGMPYWVEACSDYTDFM